ncbi:gluconate 5-dehydrogenase [Streptomyces sp. DvalAA-14]|uniref:SDR family NAD(P)-dependent oxidoreductase n=1 Tax=unclassified Streptomyces TaxID=2593676 RepID=UPI00081B49CA|nr:SDR family NAD(P)-dependent oxidoreductase [Streptomyces sp. DvalAA-14]MYS24090.1 SDR family NAD(P)-dependent oxidoreductase [Streptomyces sp. SID4948]SCE42521.1 gluconate 5-dehydrogenase [Streptomyces sp. DvalAA-14]
MDLGLAGKTTFVTGSTRGIGLAIARGLPAEGAAVAVRGRDDERLAPCGVPGIRADPTDDDDLTRTVDETAERIAGPDLPPTDPGATFARADFPVAAAQDHPATRRFRP